MDEIDPLAPPADAVDVEDHGTDPLDRDDDAIADVPPEGDQGDVADVAEPDEGDPPADDVEA